MTGQSRPPIPEFENVLSESQAEHGEDDFSFWRSNFAKRAAQAARNDLVSQMDRLEDCLRRVRGPQDDAWLQWHIALYGLADLWAEYRAMPGKNKLKQLWEKKRARMSRAFSLTDAIVRHENMQLLMYRHDFPSEVRRKGFLFRNWSESKIEGVQRRSHSDIVEFSEAVFSGESSLALTARARRDKGMYPKSAMLWPRTLPEGIRIQYPYENLPVSFGPFLYALNYDTLKDRSIYFIGDAGSRLESFRGSFDSSYREALRVSQKTNLSVDERRSEFRRISQELPTFSKLAPLSDLSALYEFIFHQLEVGDVIKMPSTCASRPCGRSTRSVNIGECLEVLVFGPLSGEDVVQEPVSAIGVSVF